MLTLNYPYMLKKLPYLLACFLAALSFNVAEAQEYQQMPISSGLNADVIANGIGTTLSSTSIDIDGVNYNYVATDYKLTSTSTPLTYGVPANGLINSIVGATPGLSYQLAPLSGNNSLRLATGGTTSGTITFATPLAATTLYMLAVTGSGAGTVTAVVNFTDATSQTFTGVAVADWFGGTNPAIQGIGRINRATDVLEPNTTNPRMYQISLAISAGNQPKLIQSVQVTKTSTGGEVVNVFAFSANAYTSCPAPTNIVAVSTMDGATMSWTAPSSAPSSGYEYLITTTATAPATTATPSGTVAAGVTTTTLTGLIPGQAYYFWIRSNCGATKGFWKQGTFTPAQVSFTYTGGDISTNYLDPVTVTSVTACPGDLAITVPPGYKIKSIGTSYSMTAANNGYQVEQRSLLVCTTTSASETAITSGPAVSAIGTATYNRSGINLAAGLTGTVNFQLRAWRVWQGGLPDCSTTYNKVDNNTWKIIATLELAVCTTPATPSAVAQSMCPSALYGDLQVNGIPGAVYKWYDQPTGGTAFASTAQIVPGTYYVSQTVGTCESARSTAVAITTAGTMPPAASPQTYCGGTTVAALQTTGGTNIKWYSAITGGTPLAASTELATGNYFVSQTLNSCESARATVAITIDTTPQPVAASQTFCAGSGMTVANLQATGVAGGTIKWYASATAPTPLATTTALGTGTYYATQTVGVCESTRLAVSVVMATVVAPTTFPQEVCTGATVANLVASGSPVATYKWYDSQASTTPLASTTPVATGTYYVTQTLGTCEGPKSQVAVTLNNVTTPDVAAQEFCAGATVADLEATASAGATIRWYATEASTTPLTATTVLTTNTYYVSQKLNTCESSKLPVLVTVNGVVDAPGNDPQVVCQGSTLADLSVELAEGATANWYASNTSVDALAAETVVAAGTYYVSQSIGICESTRAAVEVSFIVIDAPSTESLVVCNGTVISELVVEGIEGATFNWYSTIDSTVLLEGTAVATAGTLYVSQTVDGCESGRTAVAISVTSTASPAPADEQTFCGEAFVSDLNDGGTAGYDVSWYSPEGDLLSEGDALATGTYTVSQTFNACESPAISVSVVVTPIPDAPIGDETQEFNAGDTLADLDIEFAEGTTVEWFVFDEDVWISIPAGTPLVDGNVYGVSQSAGECESDIFSFTAEALLGTDTFVMKNVNVYPNPASDIVNIDGQETISEIVVINLLGQQVLRQQANTNSAKVNISALPQATYILQVYAANGATASFKIVKQ